MTRDVRIITTSARERIEKGRPVIRSQQPFGGIMGVLVPGATRHADCVEQGWPAWLPTVVTAIYDGDVGAPNEWAEAFEWSLELAAAIAQPVDYNAARYRFLSRLLQPLTEAAAPVPIDQVLDLLDRALSDEPPASDEWAAVRKTVWQAAFDAWDGAGKRQHDIWDATTVAARNTEHETEWVIGALAWGGPDVSQPARAAQRTALLEALQESTVGPAGAPIAGGAPCPCEGGAFCDASCECRCAEGLCGDCPPLSADERGYCSCATSFTCYGRQKDEHIRWGADFDPEALKHHPDIAYVHSNAYVLPWTSGSLPWSNFAQIVEVGGVGGFRGAVIPIFRPPAGHASPPSDTATANGELHCLELTPDGLARLCGVTPIEPDRVRLHGNVLWGEGAVTCQRCRDFLTKDVPAPLPIAGGAAQAAAGAIAHARPQGPA